MLFNSPEFIFFFLPLTLFGYYLIKNNTTNGNYALAFLVLASLFFYAWWSPPHLFLLLASMAFNHRIGKWVSLSEHPQHRSKLLLVVGISANLLTLGYFKYSAFLVESTGMLLGMDFNFTKVVLPLAISFFTFQQIAYLVDSYRGECRDYDFIHYCLFVTFFPQLIAGPIVHHSQMMPQFIARTRSQLSNDLYVGISFFVFGLFKKMVIADDIARWATPVFAVADQGDPISTMEAWGAILSYGLQLYFDFSGYADMAIGAGRMFGIRLPINFQSPFKSTSIIDFWRHWHITLYKFLRDYIYIPLGGNRRGTAIKHRNTMITMLLGGLWHGAGWNYVLWGGLHGVYLVINQIFREITPQRRFLPKWLGDNLARAFTLFCIFVSWALFRSETFNGACIMLENMFVFSDHVVTTQWIEKSDRGWERIIEFALIALLLPNTSKLMGYFGVDNKYDAAPLWRPGWITGLLTLCMFLACIGDLSNVSEFLYFQF